jgi:hypothetical protein
MTKKIAREMSEGRARYLDAMCKIIGVIGLLAGGLWTIIAYTGHLHEVDRASEIEAWKPYRSQRLDLYVEVMNLVGQIIVADDPTKAQKNADELSILYRGKARLFAEDTVQKAWTDFEICRLAERDATCPRYMNAYAAILGSLCRRSIEREWAIELPEDPATLQRLEKLKTLSH